MVKNVKIDDETHRQLRIKAAILDCNIGDLCSVIIATALRERTDSQLTELVLNYQGEDRPGS